MNVIDVAMNTSDTTIKTNIQWTICKFLFSKLFKIRKENKSQYYLKNISGKVLIFIDSSNRIVQSIANIDKAEGEIVLGLSRENGIEVREKSTLDAVFSDVFKKN